MVWFIKLQIRVPNNKNFNGILIINGIYYVCEFDNKNIVRQSVRLGKPRIGFCARRISNCQPGQNRISWYKAPASVSIFRLFPQRPHHVEKGRCAGRSSVCSAVFHLARSILNNMTALTCRGNTSAQQVCGDVARRP